jgi:hypothetical protein
VEDLIVKTVRQLSMFLENKPGTLAAVCRALSAAKISIHALSVSDGIDHAVVRIVVDDPKKALHLLGEHGILVLDREVLMLEAQNRAGEIAAIARTLADHKINIEYAYTATLPGANKGCLIIRVNNLAKAARLLRGH